MTQVTGLLCQIVTGSASGASTDGSVYLGLGGREFRLDSTADDYQGGSLREYILGEGAFGPNPAPPMIRVRNPQLNDPRSGLPLDTAALPSLPRYIRFEPESGEDDRWNVRSVAVLVYTPQFSVAFLTPQNFTNLWLSGVSGKILHLTAVIRIENSALDVGRKASAVSDS